MQYPNLNNWFVEAESGIQLTEMLPVFQSNLPESIVFDNDTWDLIVWLRRRGNRKTANVFFDKYQNNELKLLVKIYILYKRETRKVDYGYAQGVTTALIAIDHVLGPARTVLKLNNEDFLEAQHWLEKKFSKGSPSRMSMTIQEFGGWLSDFLGLRVTYKSSLNSFYYHGRKSKQNDRDQKLLSTEVIRDMLAAISRDDLILKDKFFLSALSVNIACGFRINEMTTLPVDCIVEEEGQVGLRFHPEKDGELGIRWIPNSMVPTVRKAIATIYEITEPGRVLVRASSSSEVTYKWREISSNKDAFQYFVAKLLHDWTSKSEHNMFNKTGAWFEIRKEYVDVIGALTRNNGIKKATATDLGIDRHVLYKLEKAQIAALSDKLSLSVREGKEKAMWTKDSRVISIEKVIKLVEMKLKEEKRSWIRDIVFDAQKCQLSGKVYPAPELMPDLESKYRLTGYPPLIVSKDDVPILEAKDALFVLTKYALSDANSTKSSEICYVDDKRFARWLAGEKRSIGTGNVEDSCLSRLGVIDAKTGEIAAFTWHDMRHWLNTMYQLGGLSEDMIALIFGRKVSSNHIYDQTDMNTRIDRLRDSVRHGKVLGHLTETYNMLAEYSRDDAEQYLKANTLMGNPMPHGICTNNWSAIACPHHLSCFVGNHDKSDDDCEHLVVDPHNMQSVLEIKRIYNEASIAIDVIPLQSPQHVHFLRVQKNTRKLLQKLDDHSI
ncbi:MAG: hypothetical protein Q8N02_10660 [Methylotenera sp.]|nr:hypothetical protein [Methylotenera sp.]MDP2404359.1 hypothetical protein [Methylotenera sp.]MDP3096022.1 hypothetical protein [Methylotenera sp.]MDZ4223706.1 hypothetical protein [Methylotenera sp.]